jgi:hypothetical protein
MKTRNLYQTVVAAVVAVSLSIITTFALCPDPGSGAAGVAAWALENCGEEATCNNPATTCNNEFTIELLNVTEDGSFVTFEYEVCRIGGSSALSHWGIGLGQIDCLGEEFDIEDLVVSVTMNGEDIEFDVGLDPTTQLFGIKFNEGEGDVDSCNTYAVTFDTSVLEEGQTLGVGCVVAATKAGNQDITRVDRDSPGYACIAGPVCEVVEEFEECWEGQTAWADGERYVARGNWATWTECEDGTVTLYAGQTLEAGTVEISGCGTEEVTIIITLNEGWRFAEDEEGNPVPENLKIQGYECDDPALNLSPSPGLFTTSKTTESGNSAEVTVDPYCIYGIHVDVQQLVECPEELIEE